MSLRMRIFGTAVRPGMRWFNARVRDPHYLRAEFERAAQHWFPETPLSVHIETCYAGPTGPMGAYWVQSGAILPDKVILHLHGGGYVVGSPETHRRVAARLSRMAKRRVFLPSYRRAPEDPLPAAFDDAVAAHAHLLRIGYAPRDIVIGGDSAGGGLALSLLSHLCETGQRPAGLYAWSPFCDQTFSGASVQENGETDHFFPGRRVHELPKLILGQLKQDDPRASPLNARYDAPPPVLLQVSRSEILRDDAFRMAEKLRAAGGDVTLQSWEGAPHVWQFFQGYFPEAREAVQLTADFVRRCLD
ncbi:alpha/beta hydrolase [Mesobacterium pallidum]|uniref:alpha/beta hydrolase n=1 Tax=Mesobacterium pallidum TaxID=2872037 RepID=UPI001EE25B41|nr:alpha/beta hydrolase [Mesobacterium pallidum]